MAKKIVAAAVVAAVLAGLLWYSQRRPRPEKISGFIEADEIRLGSRVGGRVLKVHVAEGQAVEAGTALVELDPFNLRELRAQAAALLEGRRADLAKLKAGFRAEEIAQAKAKRDELAARVDELVAGPRKETIAAAQARRAQAQAEQAYAEANVARVQASKAQGAATQEELDRATRGLEVAKATLAMRQAELAELEAGTRPEDIAAARAQLEQADQAWQLAKHGSRAEDIAAADSAVQAAEAALAALDNQLAELVIRAPINGVVEALDLRPGDLVTANAPCMSLQDPRRLWVRAFLPEDFPGVEKGNEVVVTADSQPGRRFKAKVGFISREAEFTPSNVQTPEKRSLQVFRVKVYLDEGLDVLRPGMPADVWLRP